MSTKDQADRILAALEGKPELREEIRRRLQETPPQAKGEDSTTSDSCHVAWAVLMVEHEFGQRDEGYTLFLTKEKAAAYADEEGSTGHCSTGQGFSYHVHPVTVASWVFQFIQGGGRPYSVSNHLPQPGTIITRAMVR